MSIDLHPKPQIPQEQVPSLQRTTRRFAWKRGLSLMLVIGLLLSGAALLAKTIWRTETASALTHVIARDDLVVTVTEQGMLESSENIEFKSKVRGWNAVLWIIESGTFVEEGDELVRLDSLFIQEQIDERTKYANWSQSAADHSAARVARATIAVSEYQEGRYITQRMRLKKDLVIAESGLRTAENSLRHANAMAKSEYISELEIEEKQFAVQQARLNVDLKKTELDVLERFTQKEQMQTLEGNLKAVAATHEANAERAMADASRRDRALDEIEHCVVRADRSGLVIHPNSAKWESAPIAEGTNVHKDQVLLLMPDLSKMQVKLGIHESYIDRMREGLAARVTVPGKTLDGAVSSVASVTRPASWWNGNEVTYDTLVALPPMDGLRPGMSAEVEVIIAEYHDVLTIPVAAIIDQDNQHFCWVRTPQGDKPRELVLGDSNNVFTVVQDGLQEGDEVLLNPPAVAMAKPEANKGLPNRDRANAAMTEGN